MFEWELWALSQAAVTIQKCYRGYCVRVELAVQWAASQRIQAAWRSSAARARYSNTLRRITLVQARYLSAPQGSAHNC